MAKVVISGDLHLHNYRQHNLFDDPYFRLHQFGTLASRIIEICHQNNARYFIIAGDVLHVAHPDPVVGNYFRYNFLQPIISAGIKIKFTSGQHEMSSRTAMGKNSSWLNAYQIEGADYLHYQADIIDGKSFWYQGWTPDQDFSTIKKGDYNYLVSHITVVGASMSEHGVVTSDIGQKVPSDKFDLVFVGDIHRPQNIGNIWIPGAPIQHGYGDHPENRFLVLDTATDQVTSVSTHDSSNHKFLRLLIDDHPEKYKDDPYIVARKPTDHRVVSVDKLYETVNVGQIITAEVVKNDLQNIHEQVVSNTRVQDDRPDARFVLRNVKIKNFRSIDYLELNMDDQLMVFVGENGSGKTSAVSAIRYLFEGHGSAKKLVRRGQKEMSVYGEIFYENTLYTVERGHEGKGFLEIKAGGVPIEGENLADLEKKLSESFKFMTYRSLMFRSQEAKYLLGELNYNNRIDLIKKAINLDIVDSYFKVSQALLSNKFSEIKSLDTSIQVLQGKIDTAKNALSAITLDGTKEHWVSMHIQCSTSLTNLLNEQRIRNDYDKTITDIEVSKVKLSQFTPSEFENLPDIAAIEKELSSLKSQITERKNLIQSIDADRTTKNKKLTDLTVHEGKLSSDFDRMMKDLASINAGNCTHCGSIIGADKVAEHRAQHMQKISEIGKSRGEVQAEITLQKELIAQIPDGSVYHSQITDLTVQMNKFSSKKDEYLSLARKKILYETEVSISEDLSKKLLTFGTQRNTEVICAGITEVQTLQIEAAQKIKLFESVEKITSELENCASEYDAKVVLLASTRTEADRLQKYSDIMSPKGIIIRSVMEAVSQTLTNDQFEVVAFKTLASGEVRPDFNMKLNVDGDFIEYDELSGGQKVLCDFYLFNRLLLLIGGLGLVILDETFSQSDPTNFEQAVKYLRESNIQNIMIISHHQNIPDYDRIYNFSRVNGTTQYNVH